MKFFGLKKVYSTDRNFRKVRPFQVISLFLVNFTSKNLPGNQEKTNEATHKKQTQKHTCTAEKTLIIKGNVTNGTRPVFTLIYLSIPSKDR